MMPLVSLMPELSPVITANVAVVLVVIINLHLASAPFCLLRVAYPIMANNVIKAGYFSCSNDE